MIDSKDGAALTRPLYLMFNSVPQRYDLVNSVITWGLDRRWRRQAARECLAIKPRRVLDLCCGTGDLALNLARLAEDNVEILGIDYSQPMLEMAAKKAAHVSGRVSFLPGDAAALPFPDGHFDSVGTSFAFRNLTYRNPHASRHIAEVLRVLRAGGRFVIVESSQPRVKPMRRLFHLYVRWFVFRAGSLISGNRAAYHYLAESVARFYSPEEVTEMLLNAGFSRVAYHLLFPGAAAIHVAEK